MLRLLLVEDQEIIRRGLKTILETKPDLRVIAEAENGQRAIDVLTSLHAAQQPPDVVLMDIRMPVMDGVTATQHICQRFPGTKILILTTFDDTQYVAEALRHGAKGYLLKDMPTNELAEAIASIHRGYTQFGPGILEKMMAHVPNEMETSAPAPKEADGPMTPEQLLAIANSALVARNGKHLSDVETAIVQGAIANHTYEEIAETSGYSVSYLKRDVGPKLWKSLSDALGESVSKTNFQAALERWRNMTRGKAETTTSQPEPASKSEPATLPSVAEPVASPMATEIYVERPPTEIICYETLLQPGALVRIKAPRLMGKTALITRILSQVSQHQYRTASFSFELADRNTHLTSMSKFMRWFCSILTRELGLPNQLDEFWNEEEMGVKISCTTYFEEYLLPHAESPLVLCLDDVDLLFPHPEIYEDFFGLLRSWHEKAKSRPLWQKLRLVLAHSTDVYIRLHINQSPFNVGLPIELTEFTREQVQELAQQHGLSGDATLITPLMEMVGGHPYLLEQAFVHLRSNPHSTLEMLLSKAPTEMGIYGSHLREYWLNLNHHPDLLEAFKGAIASPTPVQLEPMAAYQLQRMGLVKFVGTLVAPRCNLYRQYFAQYLLQ
ncbi:MULTISPECIES: AAA-like domain-containing protein [unclassified Leptolyngbya]|uniref:AAA-like domain-containing protein n=1 Tax=unclassified Leptolyngbya TaxID=2650499 RepID=UPI001683E62C|nr:MULTISPECIES: AAA-like domain-containing protein [unclassified Leptolyngbya]MBD1912937.1 AAA-like domain-containing protein [Leptolyngbya sp. FACHB-8]MBD2154734.1 AAA-like domain-containing protein [Leptolyngbya sp. FACHB-16]